MRCFLLNTVHTATVLQLLSSRWQFTFAKCIEQVLLVDYGHRAFGKLGAKF